MLNAETINQYLVTNGINDLSGYLLKDNGSGNVIVRWDYGIAEPSIEQLNNYWLGIENGRKSQQARQECREHIRALYPCSDGTLRNDMELNFEQNNLIAEMLKLLGIEQERLNSGNTRPALGSTQLERIQQLKTLEADTRAFRAKCKDLINLIDSCTTTEELDAINTKDDIHWL